MARIDRLRARMLQATEWATLAKGESSWTAAAALLKAAEVFDERLGEMEAAQSAEIHHDDKTLVATITDTIRGLPESARENVIAQLSGRIH